MLYGDLRLSSEIDRIFSPRTRETFSLKKRRERIFHLCYQISIRRLEPVLLSEAERSPGETGYHNDAADLSRSVHYVRSCPVDRIGSALLSSRDFRVNAFAVYRCFTTNRKPLCHSSPLSQRLQ